MPQLTQEEMRQLWGDDSEPPAYMKALENYREITRQDANRATKEENVSKESEEMKNDPVNHPSHYTQGGIECIDAIKAALSPEEFRGFLRGNALKYMWRAPHKGKPVQDVDKAMWYEAKYKEVMRGEK